MSAADEVARAMLRLRGLTQDIFTDVVLEAAVSITDGSAITGSPGQPVDTGALRASWQVEEDAPLVATIGTNLEYAQAIEDGVGPHGPRAYGKKNNIGGSHSRALTIAGMPRIVDAVVAAHAGKAP
jgi:hypothetical protein